VFQFINGYLASDVDLFKINTFSYVGYFICFIAAHLIMDIKRKLNTGTFYNRSSNIYYKDGKFVKGIFILMIARGIHMYVTIYIALISFYFASIAKINPGIIASIFQSGSIFTSVWMLLLYKERLSKYHIFGILFLISGAVTISFGKPSIHPQ
jgi:drug/metabolite transporter (DMT)-like permease